MLKQVDKKLFQWAFSEFPRTSERALKSLSLGRSAFYLSESLPLVLINLLRKNSEERAAQTPPPEYRQAIVTAALELLEQDSEDIVAGYYGPEVLWPEQGPLQHLGSLAHVFKDALKWGKKQNAKNPHVFSAEAQDLLQDVPDYYKRNFHFQTDGYLSDLSADLYDHQVEILFRGISHAMRRLLLRPMKEQLSQPYLRILDVGCGTGSSTRFLAQAFPDAKITAFDLSFPYLKKAQSRLPRYSRRIEYVQGTAEEMPFKDGHFDAVVSTFLFHELPLDVRKKVLLEMKRVVKENGFFGVIDSQQKADRPELLWGLRQFPRDFHEPFYKNYLNHPMEELLREAGLHEIKIRLGFLSKALWAKR